MSKELTADTPASAPEAGELPELTLDNLTDERLNELVFGVAPETPAATTEAPAEQAPEVKEDAAPAPEAVADEIDMEALDALDKTEAQPETVATPQDEFVQKVKQVLPNDEALNYAVEAFDKQTRFERAVQDGDVSGALNALPTVKPFLRQAITEYLKANEGKIVDAYIQRQTGEARNPEVDTLLQKVNQLESRLKSEDSQKEQAAHIQKRTDTLKAIDNTFVDVLDKVKFTSNESDRSILSDLFKTELARNNDALKKAMNGDMSVLRPIAKTVIKRYVDADKARSEKRAAARTATETAPVITKGGVGSDSKLSRDEEASNFILSLQKGQR